MKEKLRYLVYFGIIISIELFCSFTLNSMGIRKENILMVFIVGVLLISTFTKGYFYGWKTAIHIGAYNDNGEIVEIGTVSSGLTDELRDDFAKHPENYLNRVVSLQCMEKSVKDHTLRHAFFKGFRNDKNPQDCLLNTIF